MRRFHSFEDVKRVIYLYIIPISIMAFIIYLIEGHDPLYVLITELLIAWNVISWIFIFIRRYQRIVELITLLLVSFSHLATLYDTIFHYMAKGREGAWGVSIIWIPLVIFMYFLILHYKWGLIYSFINFCIIVSFGIMNFSQISSNYRISLGQFYVAYFIYILVFYTAHHIVKLFSELEGLKKDASTDSLTGIANRHQINQWLDQYLDHHFQLSILFFDMDHFKKINDTFGHNVGDSVLKELVHVVKVHLTDDLFGRWGGEEFIIISFKSGEAAAGLAEQLRLKVKEHVFKKTGKQTVSFGVTEYQKGEGAESCVSRADHGLYQSKEGGRDQVTLV